MYNKCIVAVEETFEGRKLQDIYDETYTLID